MFELVYRGVLAGRGDDVVVEGVPPDVQNMPSMSGYLISYHDFGFSPQSYT